MKKIVLLLVAVLILISIVKASSTYSGWVYSGNSVKVGSLSVMILDAGYFDAWFDDGKEHVRVKNNSCGTTNFVKACVNDMQYDISRREYKFSIALTTIEPTVTVTRTSTRAILLAGEEVEITTTITNSGNGEAKNMEFRDSFGDDLIITESSGGLVRTDKMVSWKGSLRPSETITFTYKIKVLQKTKRVFKAEVKYFDGLQTKIIYSSALTFTVEPFVTVKGVSGKSTWYIAEKNNVTINITNNEPSKTNTTRINVTSLTIRFDDTIEIITYPPELKRLSNTIFEWSDMLRVNRSKAFLFYVKGTKALTINIYVKANYIDSEGTARETEEKEINVKVEDKETKIVTNINDLTIESYENKTIKIWVQNTNFNAKIKDVNVTTHSELTYLENAFIKEILPGEMKLVISKDVEAPYVTSSTGYKFYVNISYKTEYDENRTKKLTDTLTIKPIKDIEITQSIDKITFYTADEAAVTVRVKNPRNVKIKYVRIYDGQLQYFTTQGVTSITTNINKEDTINAYTYIIKAKKVSNETTEYVNTTVEYSDGKKNYYYSTRTKLTVKPPVLTLTLTKTVTDTEVYKGDYFYIEYTIKNPSSDQRARNLKLKFPLQKEFDRIDGQDSYEIEGVGPGEEAIVYEKEKLRAKINESLNLAKTRLEYENEYGDNLSVESGEVSVTIKTKEIEGPYIIIERNTSDEVNNTEEFVISTRIKNEGKNKTRVTLEEDGNRWIEIVYAGSEVNYTTKKLVSKAGDYNLTQLIAEYQHDGRKFKTASSVKTIKVLDKPVLTITKTASEANNINPTLIILKLKAAQKVTNITLADDGKEWQIGELEGEKNISYEKLLTIGKQTLTLAEANYTYKKAIYNVTSNLLEIEVKEKQVITITKIQKTEVNKSQTFNVTLKLKNSEKEEIKNIKLKDMEKEWTISLKAGEERIIGYQTTLKEIKEYETQANASYTYKGQELISKSEIVKIRVFGEEKEEVKKEKIKEEKPKSIAGKILYYLKKLVTFRIRGEKMG